MKLHRLEVEGFGPFHRRQVVDFDAFDADGIFLIAGRTGAGKSSILDGVCFALYGIVPRYDGAEKRLRSDYCAPEDPTEVVLEFSAGDHRYRVVRSPEYDRPKARGVGTTPQKARAELAVLDGGQWRGLSAKVGEVGAMLTDEIVGLSRDQFLQVILLAQGRFAEFLLAKNDDRQALLRNLFGSRTYRDYEQILQMRRAQSQKALDQRTGEVGFLLADAEATIAEHDLAHSDPETEESAAAAAAPLSTALRLDGLDQAVQRAVARADQAAGALESAQTAYESAAVSHTRQTALRDLQGKRISARESFAALEQRSPVVEAERMRRDAAVAAEALRATIETAAAADRAREDARATERAVQTEWTARGGSAELADDELGALEERLTGEIAVHSTTLMRERELSALESRLTALTARIEDDERHLAALDALRAATARRLPEIDDALVPLEAAAARRALAEQRVESLAPRLTAAHDVVTLAPAARLAAEDHQKVTSEHARAVATVASLLQRRLDDAAGELASQLAEGDPCAVCGSREHPHPAPAPDERVTDADVDAAQQAATAAAERAVAAADAVRLADARLAEAHARSEGIDAVDIERDLEAARLEVRAAAAAEAAREALVLERDGLRAADAAAEVERGARADSLAAVREEVAVVRDQAATIRLDVTAARGEHDSVAARIDATTAQRDLARALLAARAAHLARADAARDATRDLERRVDATRFTDVAAVADALLDPDAREALSADIRAHEADLAAQRETLRVLELELAGSPEDLVDLEQTAAELAAAASARDAAMTAAGAISHIAERLRGLHERATAAHEATAELVGQHERLAALADAVAGRNPKKMDLETFVLAAELEEIVAAASRRLLEMSTGRYELRHSDALASHGGASGLALAVVDSHTGKARSPQSLSGGERFLASLALALGLAEVVTARAGGLRLDTLFIDEGFGSLDEDTLELAMRTLDELRQGGRTVGLISHVAAMKEQIPAQLAVVAAPHGPSAITQEVAPLPV